MIFPQAARDRFRRDLSNVIAVVRLPTGAESTWVALIRKDAADTSETPSIATPERTARSANGLNEFRSERWIELYKKKIEDMIGVVKAKGVPVLWVGLPALRGPKATSDMLFLDSLYRESAAKTGIT